MSIRAGLLATVLVLGAVGPAWADIPPPGPARVQPGPRPANPPARRNADAELFGVGVLVCAVAVGALVGIGIKVWIILFIVSDARKRGMDPTMYVILEIFVGIVGLIVYLCSREPLLSERRRRRGYDEDEEDEDDLDRPRPSRRLRDRDEDDYNRWVRGRTEDY